MILAILWACFKVGANSFFLRGCHGNWKSKRRCGILKKVRNLWKSIKFRRKFRSIMEKLRKHHGKGPTYPCKGVEKNIRVSCNFLKIFRVGRSKKSFSVKKSFTLFSKRMATLVCPFSLVPLDH